VTIDKMAASSFTVTKHVINSRPVKTCQVHVHVSISYKSNAYLRISLHFMPIEGDAPPLRKKKWRDFEKRIIRLKGQYDSGQRTAKQFWYAMAYNMANVI
jgi:hypothetical protein